MHSIRTWRRFRQSVRATNCALLAALSEYPDSILVTGCQRSGTTILSRIIAGTDGIQRFAFTTDDELDAALILSGRITGLPRKRYCFQTTYMYDSHDEYVKRMTDQKMIWVLRNPHSVVYSMLHNWKTSSLNELFMGCGIRHLTEPYRYRLQRFGIMGVPRLIQACLSYRSKLDELHWLRGVLPESALLVINYDDLIERTQILLPIIYERLNLAYRPGYGAQLNGTSTEKARRLSASERGRITDICLPAYDAARKLVNVGR